MSQLFSDLIPVDCEQTIVFTPSIFGVAHSPSYFSQVIQRSRENTQLRQLGCWTLAFLFRGRILESIVAFKHDDFQFGLLFERTGKIM